MRFIKLLIFVLFFANLSNANAQLLSNLQTDDKNTAEEILEVLLPIVTYDPNAVNVRVIEEDINIFKGIDEDLKTEFSSSLDDAEIYKWLNAKDGEILLSVPVEVTINEGHLNLLEETLKNTANNSQPVEKDNNSNDKNSSRGFGIGQDTVYFYIGSIKGTPRENFDDLSNEIHSALGLKNQTTTSKALNGDGVWVHKPFRYYGFRKEHNNGKLCETIINKIGMTTKPDSVYNSIPNKLRAGSNNKWSTTSPAIKIKFFDKDQNILLDDVLALVDAGSSTSRPMSPSGWGSAQTGENDTYQSIVTADTTNGWHPQDRYSRSTHRLNESMRFSEITKIVHYSIDPIRYCRFGIAEQTNFRIVTKVDNLILQNTAKIVVEYDHHTIQNSVNCLSPKANPNFTNPLCKE